jgi:hypothetical protein
MGGGNPEKDEKAMIFTRYDDTGSFATDTLEIMLEHEVQNNLPISFIGDETAAKSDWLLASVKDPNGGVVLVAACTPPFNIVLFETGNRRNDDAVRLLSDELRGGQRRLHTAALPQQRLRFVARGGAVADPAGTREQVLLLVRGREQPGFLRDIPQDGLLRPMRVRRDPVRGVGGEVPNHDSRAVRPVGMNARRASRFARKQPNPAKILIKIQKNACNSTPSGLYSIIGDESACRLAAGGEGWNPSPPCICGYWPHTQLLSQHHETII